ncbi:MAG TPA: hypothetical protein VHE81_04285 [Lacipirellulaceae bacterium]|nr:hypothetical protein [Lacipirellulaceae bacterium]
MATQPKTYRPRYRYTVLCTLMTFGLFALAATWVSAASIIDFETTPASLTPVDDAPLSSLTPYLFPGLQVSFGIDSDSNGSVDTDAVFEHAGLNPGEPPNAGFSGSSGTDTADPGFTAQLGNWFLRSPVGGSDFGLFVITYSGSTTITAASGEIWDIDGTMTPGGQPGNTEEYTVRAYDAANNLLATQVSPLGILSTPFAPLDGEPWTFSFSGLSAGIAKITVDFTGTKPMGIGLAFNNFNPTGAAVPEPAGLLTLAIGMMLFPRRTIGGSRSDKRA